MRYYFANVPDDPPFYALSSIPYILFLLFCIHSPFSLRVLRRCEMETFFTSSLLLTINRFFRWQKTFSNYHVESSQCRSLGTTTILKRSFFTDHHAGLWHKQDALPFRIFHNRSRESFARDIKWTRGTITYARSCQWLFALANIERIAMSNTQWSLNVAKKLPRPLFFRGFCWEQHFCEISCQKITKRLRHENNDLCN